MKRPQFSLNTCVPAILAAAFLVSTTAAAVELDDSWESTQLDDSWESTLADAKGQTVYFNAWGGSDRINSYLDWAADRIAEEYDVTLEHVKIGDIAEVVSQLEAAKAVGKVSEGNVDLMWVNGENFAAMKSGQLSGRT